MLATVVAAAQTVFIDDADREVRLPAQIQNVFAAGFPAEILLYTLAPDMLAGRNHLPANEALEFIPPAYRSPVSIANLPDRYDPALDADLLRLRSDVFIDYGSLDADYVAVVDAVQNRTGIASIILNGGLERVPATYRRLGAALGVAARGEQLATEAERILAKYRGVLAKPLPLRVYMACTSEGTIPCLEGESAGELLGILGAVNTAGSVASSLMRPLTVAEITALNVDVIVADGIESAARLRTDPAWQGVPAVRAGRVVAPPALPFNWGSRPPSVNRLPGLVWLAYALPGRALDAAFRDDVRQIFRVFYHVDLTPAQLDRLVAGR
jgi:iron complex transport system substrate-binding protein